MAQSIQTHVEGTSQRSNLQVIDITKVCVLWFHLYKDKTIPIGKSPHISVVSI
jgi:hypothetical protein